MNVWTTLGVWVAVLLTLAMFSFLYRENPVYRVAEHILVGVGAAYSVLLLFYRVFIPFVWNGLGQPESAGAFVWTLLFTLISLLFLAPLVPRWGWLASIPSAIAVGYAAGQELPAAIQAKIYPQLADSAEVFEGGGGFWGVVNALIILIGTITVLIYFMMTVRQGAALGGVSRVGIVFLMIGFGAVFGNMAQSRFAVLIERIEFIVGAVTGGGVPS